MAKELHVPGVGLFLGDDTNVVTNEELKRWRQTSKLKSLAKATHEVNGEIANQISVIQASTMVAARDIEVINKTITESITNITDVATTVASEVTGQEATKQAIAENIQRAADLQNDISNLLDKAKA